MNAPNSKGDDHDSLSSSSSYSDDEYLVESNNTTDTKMTQEDREAMIRKKLLESFYGSSSASMPVDGEDEDEEDEEEEEEEEEGVTAQDVSFPMASSDAAAAKDSSSSTAAAAEKKDGNKSTKNHPPLTKNSLDLDSPSFNSVLHSRRHIQSSSISTLLTTNENLALDIRSLDSTMQTLVYENYSKFIDATDAIRSIGQSVHDSEVGLDRLQLAINNIEARTGELEDALKVSRDAVAEKLRVKRLLNRLDALLKLPSTLRTYIDSGKYRLAAKSHVSATAILTKHSAGFESLKSIELECNVILRRMVKELRNKMIHWSGEVMKRSPLIKHKHLFEEEGEGVEDSVGDGLMDTVIYSDDEDDEETQENDNDEEGGEKKQSSNKLTLALPPPPPDTISEIFECSGTLLLLATVISTSVDKKDIFAVKFSKEKCKALALDACGRLLNRRLDVHGLEVKEETDRRRKRKRQKEKSIEEIAQEGELDVESQEPSVNDNKSYLIPISFLDGILESVTLYGVTFSTNTTTSSAIGGVVGLHHQPKEQDAEDQELLCDFVEDMFGKFLGYVRVALLERSLHRIDDEDEDDSGAHMEEKKYQDSYSEQQDDEAFADISHALTTLLRSVRDLASGLALPEVGLDVRVASGLVDRTVEITESMVRRRVSRIFHSLRFRILKDCLGPFVDSVVLVKDEDEKKEGEEGGTRGEDMARVVEVVQSASVALSDGMQLVDDTIREIFSRRNETSLGGVMAAPVDSAIVKLAVKRNARRLALWLAHAFEIAAGCEPADSPLTLEVRDASAENNGDDESDDGGLSGSHHRVRSGDSGVAASAAAAAAILDDDIASLYSDDDGYDFYGTSAEEEEDEATLLLDSITTRAENAPAKSDLTLAISEMCRLAERSVAENMSQSIANATMEESRVAAKAVGLFGKLDDSVSKSGQASGAARGQQIAVDSDGAVAKRFRSAASRALTLYATDRGSRAADVVCEGFFEAAIAAVASSTGLEEQASSSTDTIPTSPRDGAWKCLEIAALASVDCANVFGGERAAGPVPPFPDDDGGTGGHLHHRAHSGIMGPIHGLQLDVERMFTERVQIYSHPSRIVEFTRNAVVTTVLKVAFRALLENSRLCEFSEAGYRQMQVDVDFFRHMVPHYVKDDFMADGTNGRTSLYNLLNDVMLNVGQRCLESECVGVDEYYDPARACIVTPLSIIREFMRKEDEKDSGGTTSKFVLSN